MKNLSRELKLERNTPTICKIVQNFSIFKSKKMIHVFTQIGIELKHFFN
jgi:hypothetical protein